MKKVLLIDDDSNVRTLLKRLLEKKFRMKVVEACDGLEGVNVFKQESPDLIFLDISMPVMDGFECLSNIRLVNTKVPVVVLSCLSNRECVEKMIGFGITDYVVKSDFVLSLHTRIYDILEKYNFLID